MGGSCVGTTLVYAVLCLNAFIERKFMNSFIILVNLNERTVFLPDERYCERVHSGVCERHVHSFLISFNKVQAKNTPLALKCCPTIACASLSMPDSMPNKCESATVE